MTNDLMKLMAYIDSLQSEPTPEPVIEEVEETKVHPLLQAMQELKEAGVVDEYVNKDTIEPNFTAEKEIHNGYIIKATGLDSGKGIKVEVFDPKNPYKLFPIADATFKINPDDKTLTSSLTSVSHKYRKQGIARAMYQFVHDLGNDIQASNTLLPDGRRMWDAFKSQGTTFSNEPEEPAKPEVKKSFWQRLFKEADAIDEEIAYHGTTDDINQFHPFTHFGTEKAAKDRMLYKKIKDGKIYKVDLDIKNPLTIKDFPGIHYDRLYAFELKDKGLISQEEMEAITFIQDKQELRNALLNKLNELGIDGFVYKNKYEDKGNISYVIVDPSQVKVLSVEPATEEVAEASPDTLEGSFTPDLVESKTWLAEKLAQGLKGKNAGTIYVLGSWYGNMGIFLQQAGVKFDKLVLVEPDEESLMRSKELLDTLNDDGKLILIHQNAEDVVYEKPGVVINTSCNETGPVFLTKLPDNMLCLLQARNNVDNVLIETDSLGEFKDLFPLSKTYYTGEKELIDPETEYTRYMIIGRSGKKLDETISTGLGGGSAGNNGGPMVGGPKTYEEEYGMFKTKGPRRIMAMTENEQLFPQVVNTITKNVPNVKKIYFHGSRAIGKEKRNSDWDILVIVDDSIVGSDYINTVFSLQNIAKKFKNFDIQPSHENNNIARIAKEEGKLLYSSDQKIDEALDSSYPYEGKAISGRYSFETEDGVFYKVYFQGKDLVEIAFSAILPGEEENFRPDKTTITGTGNSRKVFGTVIKIVQDYVDAHEPKALYFIAGDEPSRIRLYQTMTDQVDKALPDYYAVKPTDLGAGKAFMLKRKTDKVNEALDSSYEYVSGQKPGVFYFETEDGNEYKVDFSGNNKKTEIAFAQRGQGDEHKTGITGTGNSRKIFGTVINIVKDYMSKAKPDMLIFNANNSEPSRVRLYKMLANQADSALPDYSFAKALSDGTYTTYYLTRSDVKVPALDKIKAAGFKALDKIVGESAENKTTLTDIYNGNYPDHDELIWNYIGASDLDTPFTIETINPNKLNMYLTSQYRIEHIEELFDMMDEDQRDTVEHYETDPTLSDQIIVMSNGRIIDGNHRALAAVLSNRPIKYIDIGEEDESLD